MDNIGWLSVLPPLFAIVLAIKTKQVFLSLFFGIWLGWTILSSWNPLVGVTKALNACVEVFKDEGNTKVILFSAMVGALIAFTQRSGGVEGFVNWVLGKNVIKGRKSAGLLAWCVGLVIFVESSITCLVTGAIARPIFDRLKISREKLAYICDSTSAPVCILIPLNAWGAYIVGLLINQGVENPVKVLVKALPLNFYALFALLLVLYIALTERDFGAMRAAERRAHEEGKVLREGAEPLIATEVIAIATKDGTQPKARNMVIPVATMVLAMPVGLLITGKGNLMNGSGATSVFWAVLMAISVAGIIYMIQGIFKLAELSDLFLKGVGGLIPMAVLMLLAFAIGRTCNELGTGPYVANLAKGFVSPRLVPAILFLVSCFIAFSTGTSWGTFAIMMPIGIPMVSLLGGNLYPAVAAILGGGVFGDHCSPISDTTIIASMASASDHIDHVRTQLPYALTAAAMALLGYLIIGLF